MFSSNFISQDKSNSISARVVFVFGKEKNRAKVAHCTLHIALDTASDTALQTVQDCNTKKVKYFEEPIMRNNERGKK